jgi:ADP-ribose pyrophosphatase YjhB (NUDIX family)
MFCPSLSFPLKTAYNSNHENRPGNCIFRPLQRAGKPDKALILIASGARRMFSPEKHVGPHDASAWVINQNHDKALMVYHNIYQSWSWLGGHADGDENLLAVALREIQEESGLTKLKPIQNSIFSLEVLTVDGHEKHGHYVSSHLHLNVTYLIEADDQEKLAIKEDENSGVRCFLWKGPSPRRPSLGFRKESIAN